ncbi:MAG TPA: DVUA0089 family protein [Acidobacteriaceae bacterium]|jgi:hypothetical protein
MRVKPWARVWALVLGAMVWGQARGHADTVSYTGTLANPEDTFSTTVTLTASGTVTLQTYGFGGGVNAAGTTIAPGGFDAFVGLFSGTGDGAVFVDGTSDILTNYMPGCPPAGTATIGSVGGQCGDVTLELTGLSAGTYTVLLTDAAYLPAAVYEIGGTLGDGFFDLTGGAFQTCVDENNCNTDTADWALDVTTGAGSGGTTPGPVPEPPSVELAGMGMLLVTAWMYRRQRQELNEVKGRA